MDNVAGYSINTSTMHLDGATTAGAAYMAGDSFTVEDDPTVYILTADATFSSNEGDVSFYPPLQKDVEDGDEVTFTARDAVELASAGHTRNLMFHRNAFALAFAPLPRTGDGRGAQIAVVSDPVTGLAVRARMYYNGDTATNFVALDTLYGMQVLNSQMAVRVLRARAVFPA